MKTHARAPTFGGGVAPGTTKNRPSEGGGKKSAPADGGRMESRSGPPGARGARVRQGGGARVRPGPASGPKSAAGSVGPGQRVGAEYRNAELGVILPAHDDPLIHVHRPLAHPDL